MKRGRPRKEDAERQAERKHRLACLLRSGLSVGEACRAMRLNRATGYRWLAAMRVGRIANERVSVLPEA